MLPIATKLLEQRLREVETELKRVAETPAKSGHTLVTNRELTALKDYRKQVLRELEVLDTV